MSEHYGHAVAALLNGVVIANLSFDAYPEADDDPIAGLTRELAQIYKGAMRSGAARFDGSDLLPPAVEAAFREGLMQYIGEAAPDLDAILAAIEATWQAGP